MLVDYHHEKVNRDKNYDQGGHQQNVQTVESGNNLSSRKLATEQSRRDSGSNNRNSLDHSINDAKAVSRKKVIWK